jgi:hypothetical protein
MLSLIPQQPNQNQVRLYVDRVNAEWDPTSKESMWNYEIVHICIDLVDVESQSALTRST